MAIIGAGHCCPLVSIVRIWTIKRFAKVRKEVEKLKAVNGGLRRKRVNFSS
jgi:hypothetical protein